MATAYNTRNALETAIWTWLATLITPVDAESVPDPSVPIIWANENGEQPLDSYLTLNLIAPNVMEGSSDAVLFNQGAEAQRIVIGNRQCTVSINSYGAAASDLLWTLKQLFEAETSEGLLESANLSIIEHTDIQDLSELRETKFQKRDQMDLRMGYTTETISGSGNTEAVEITDQTNGDVILVDL